MFPIINVDILVVREGAGPRFVTVKKRYKTAGLHGPAGSILAEVRYQCLGIRNFICIKFVWF